MGIRALEHDGGRWGHPVNHLTFTPARSATGIPSLEWCAGVTPAQSVTNLNDLSLGVDGQPFAPKHLADNQLLLTAGQTTIELRRRSACARCDRHATFRPASA